MSYNLKHYSPTGKPGEYSKIQVDYTLGGINYATGSPNKRGCYAYFAIVERSDRGTYSTESHALFGPGSFKILIREMKRDHKPTVFAAYDYIEKHADALHALHIADNKAEILNILNKFDQ